MKFISIQRAIQLAFLITSATATPAPFPQSNTNTSSSSCNVGQALKDSQSKCGGSDLTTTLFAVLTSGSIAAPPNTGQLKQLRNGVNMICTRSCILAMQDLVNAIQSDSCSGNGGALGILASLPTADPSLSTLIGSTVNSGCARSSSSSSSDFCLKRQLDVAIDLSSSSSNSSLKDSNIICDSCIQPSLAILRPFESDISTAQSNKGCSRSSSSNQATSSKSSSSSLPTGTTNSTRNSRSSSTPFSLPTTLPVSSAAIPNVNQECAKVLNPILPAVSKACGSDVFDLGVLFINGPAAATGALSAVSSSLLEGLCATSCQSQVSALNQALNDQSCSAQLVSPFHQLLAPQVASLFQVFLAVACVKSSDTSSSFCFPAQVPRLQTLFSNSSSSTNATTSSTTTNNTRSQTNSTSSTTSDLKSALTALVNATDLTCSPCALRQQAGVVHLPVTALASGIQEPMVALIAGVQMACENSASVRGGNSASITSSGTQLSTSVSSLLVMGLGFILCLYAC